MTCIWLESLMNQILNPFILLGFGLGEAQAKDK